MNVKKTAFNHIHKKLGAKIVEFAGYEMPIQYSGIIDEHMAVRNSAGLFDVSHMGEFEIRGVDALKIVQKVTTNDASKLFNGKVQYSAMCYPDGGIVDDLLVYRFDDHFMFVVNAANLMKDFEWINSQKGSLRTDIINKSDETSLLALQGPNSAKILQKIVSIDPAEMEYYTFAKCKISGVDAIISRTGYTGELGFEIYFHASPSLADIVWNSIMDAGKEFSVKPIGLGARDTLRLEYGFCLYGNDIDKTTNPLEAGLGWITKLDKGDFIGRDVLLNVKKEGLKRKLVGFTINEDKAFPRHGYEIKSNGKCIGHVTSGTFSPVLQKGIGMGYVNLPYDEAGTKIYVDIRKKQIEAQVVKFPFIKK